MTTTTVDRAMPYVRALSIATFLVAFLLFVRFSIAWQWMWDTQVMHYICFLLDHGKVPYKDIYDINMPGAYITERWAIHLFGGGDLGWRLYEFSLLGILSASMVVITLPVDWLAGLMAGVLFTLLHAAQGATQAAERDEIMTVMIVAGYAFLFEAVRKARPVLMLPFGLLLGIAALIKPTFAPFALVLLLVPVLVLRNTGVRRGSYVLFGFYGLALAVGVLIEFLVPQHAAAPFFFILRRLVPYYSTLAPMSLAGMLRLAVPATFYIYIPVWLALTLTNRSGRTWLVYRENWEIWCLRTGLLFGLVSYLVQRKGYAYHQDAYVAFALLLTAVEVTTALRGRGWQRDLALATMAFVLLLVVPASVRRIHSLHETNAFSIQLEIDLRRLGDTQLQSGADFHGSGVSTLNNRVQCLDLVSGCLRALYRLNLVQSTGFTGDLQFFAPDDGKVVPYYRRIFWDDIHRSPPMVIIVSNEWYAANRYSFDKLDAWPALRDYLDSAYTLDVTREAGTWEGAEIAYRIYVLKNALNPPLVTGTHESS